MSFAWRSRFMEPSFPQLVILSYQELPSETRIEPFAAIALADQSFRGGSPSYGKLGGKSGKSAGRRQQSLLNLDDHAN